jgi:hypothetical protein
VSRRFREPGPFAAIVTALRDERWRAGTRRSTGSSPRTASAAASIACWPRSTQPRDDGAPPRLPHDRGLTERVSYRELMPFGLTQLDLKLIPDLAPLASANLRELRTLVESLRLPRQPPANSPSGRRDVPRSSRASAQNYREAVSAATPAGSRATASPDAPQNSLRISI